MILSIQNYKIAQNYSIQKSTQGKIAVNATNTNNHYDASIYKTKGLCLPFYGNVKAIYAGSFDPITMGHMDIIQSASQMFDKVVVLVAKNPAKKGFIPVDERLKLIENAIKEANLENVIVDSAPDNLLTVEYAKRNGASVLIRGLRTVSDFDAEMQLAEINKKLNKDVRTVFLTSNSDYSAISSSAVRGILACDGDVSDFVPSSVARYLAEINKG